MVKALEELPGVRNVRASFSEKKAVVQYDPALVDLQKMCQALLKVGYVARPSSEGDRAGAIVVDTLRQGGEPSTDGLVCYCFGYTRLDIEQDLVKNGRSLIMERIKAEKKAGTCDCGNKNPKKR